MTHSTVALPPATGPRWTRVALLSLAALGVLFGDIGTSPLDALRECFHGAHGVPVTPANVYARNAMAFFHLQPDRVVEVGARVEI